VVADRPKRPGGHQSLSVEAVGGKLGGPPEATRKAIVVAASVDARTRRSVRPIDSEGAMNTWPGAVDAGAGEARAACQGQVASDPGDPGAGDQGFLEGTGKSPERAGGTAAAGGTPAVRLGPSNGPSNGEIGRSVLKERTHIPAPIGLRQCTGAHKSSALLHSLMLDTDALHLESILRNVVSVTTDSGSEITLPAAPGGRAPGAALPPVAMPQALLPLVAVPQALVAVPHPQAAAVPCPTPPLQAQACSVE
jgi:hypothetical protein